MIWLLLASLNLAAADPCDGTNCPVAVEMDAVLAAEPTTSQGVELPEGTISAEQLEALFQEIQQKGGSVRDLFAELADGKSRTLPGEVVQDLMRKYGVTLDFLPIDQLAEIVSDGESVEFKFKFSGSREIELPSAEVWVLKRGKAKKIKTDETRLKVASSVTLNISEDGIESLNKGDIKAHGGFLVGWVNIGVSTQYQLGKQATQDDYPLLVVDENNNPVVKNGQYQIQTYDDWAVITAPLTRIEIGIPSM